MKRTAPCVLFSFLLVVFVAGCASVGGSGNHNPNYDFSSVKRVAVVSVNGVGGGVRAQIANMFDQQLLGMGYSPVERTQVQAVIKEQDFSHSEVTRSAGAAKVGDILNVPAVIIVNVPRYGDKMEMGAKMVDVSTASIIWSANGVADTGSGLNEAIGGVLGAAAGAGAGQGIGGHTTGTVVGGVAGAAAGAIAGKAMTPQRQEQAAKLIKKLTQTLPRS